MSAQAEDISTNVQLHSGEDSGVLAAPSPVVHDNCPDTPIPSWKPRSLHWLHLTILCLIHFVQLVVIGGIVVPKYYSKHPARSPPEQSDGLLLDSHGPFQFADSDSGSFFLWKYTSLMIQVLAGFRWIMVDIDIRRLMPFMKMSRKEGATLKESLSSNYESMWAFLTPFYAIKQGDSVVVLSSTASLLAFSGLPILHDLMWDVRWKQEDRIITVAVNLPWVSVMLVATVVLLVLGLLLLRSIGRCKTGLQTKPAGIAGLASLICDSDILREFQRIPAYETQEYINEMLGPHRVWMHQVQTSQAAGVLPRQRAEINFLEKPVQPGASLPQNRTFKQHRSEAHPWCLRRQCILLVFVVTTSTYLPLRLTTPFPDAGLKAILIFVTTVQTSYWVAVDQARRILEPYYGLTVREKSVTLDALLVDMENMPINWWGQARRLQAGAVALFHVCMLISQVTTVIYSSYMEFLGPQYDGAIPPCLENGLAVLAIPSIIAWFILIAGQIVVLIAGSLPTVPRKPSTLSSRILYLCYSHGLLDDVRGTSNMTPENRARKLRKIGHEYAFGWFDVTRQDNSQGRTLGIELRPRVSIYRYGQTDG